MEISVELLPSITQANTKKSWKEEKKIENGKRFLCKMLLHSEQAKKPH